VREYSKSGLWLGIPNPLINIYTVILEVRSRKMPRKTAKLEGALKGVRIEEKDIEEAKANFRVTQQ
jgi:hypothetical protein